LPQILTFGIKTMTRIFCSKKLHSVIENINHQLPENSLTRSLNDWNGQLFFIDRKKILIFVNNLTNYSILIIGFKKKDLSNINNIFRQRLKNQLLHDKILFDSQSFDDIFEPIDLKFFKTNNDRRIIGNMSDLIYQFKGMREINYSHIDNMDIETVNGYLNDIPYNKPTEEKKILSFPRENMIQEINKI
jgi:hypothetical protein